MIGIMYLGIVILCCLFPIFVIAMIRGEYLIKRWQGAIGIVLVVLGCLAIIGIGCYGIYYIEEDISIARFVSEIFN